MFWLRYYELLEIKMDHRRALNILTGWKSIQFDFPHKVNKYYSETIWKQNPFMELICAIQRPYRNTMKVW